MQKRDRGQQRPVLDGTHAPHGLDLVFNRNANRDRSGGDPHCAESRVGTGHRMRLPVHGNAYAAMASAIVSATRTGRSLSGSTRRTPHAGAEVANTGRTIPRARALRRKAGVRISAVPNGSSLALSPSSGRHDRRDRTSPSRQKESPSRTRPARLHGRQRSGPRRSVRDDRNATKAIAAAPPSRTIEFSSPLRSRRSRRITNKRVAGRRVAVTLGRRRWFCPGGLSI